jgi:pimeloyl-ACP methyl ester carboxylesterase
MDLEVAGQRIHVSVRGAAGPPVVLVHSSGLASPQWRRLAERLAPTHRTFAPDLIGYGASAPWASARPASYHDDLGVVRAIVHAAGAPVHLVGHSYGGFLGLKLAREVELASLALYEPVAFGVLQSADDREALAAQPPEEHLFAPELEGTVEWCRRFVDFWQGPGAWDRLSEPMRASFARPARKMYQEVRSLAHDATPHTAYRTIAARTLLLAGARSPLPAVHVAEILARTLPDARLMRIDGAGHMGPITHADAVNDAISAHIAS